MRGGEARRRGLKERCGPAADDEEDTEFKMEINHSPRSYQRKMGESWGKIDAAEGGELHAVLQRQHITRQMN
jgi:hypothetical protein